MPLELASSIKTKKDKGEKRAKKAEDSATEKPKKAKKEKQRQEEQPSAAAAAAVPKPPKPALTPEQEAQRQRQRECREKALAARASGGNYVSARKIKQRQRPEQTRRKFEKRHENDASKGERNAQRREVQKSTKAERARLEKDAPTVVIIPIFWKGEAQQMALVTGVCSDVKASLEEGGVRCELDGGHKYTPGQKFAHWEHKGVKLRVEVGPREAQRGRCTLAKTFQPGVPARRVTGVEVGASLVGRLRELEKLAIDDAESGVEPGEAASADAAAAAGAAAAAYGGDELGDNMELPAADEDEDEDEAAEGTQKRKKKKKGIEEVEATPTAREAARRKEADAAAEAELPKKKKVKKVAF